MQLDKAWPELRNLSLDVLLPLLPAAAKTVAKAPKNGEIDVAIRVAEWNAAGCAEKEADAVLSACIALLLPPLAAQASLSFSVDTSLRQEQRFGTRPQLHSLRYLRGVSRLFIGMVRTENQGGSPHSAHHIALA